MSFTSARWSSTVRAASYMGRMEMKFFFSALDRPGWKISWIVHFSRGMYFQISCRLAGVGEAPSFSRYRAAYSDFRVFRRSAPFMRSLPSGITTTNVSSFFFFDFPALGSLPWATASAASWSWVSSAFCFALVLSSGRQAGLGMTAMSSSFRRRKYCSSSPGPPDIQRSPALLRMSCRERSVTCAAGILGSTMPVRALLHLPE
mmetsp:Transcript_71316/g.125517  ORF Transcript_71316/g.125517 Transcript_71316/m.125517 type:complete len:203 (-) Transcript_71316:78-686(-)